MSIRTLYVLNDQLFSKTNYVDEEQVDLIKRLDLGFFSLNQLSLSCLCNKAVKLNCKK